MESSGHSLASALVDVRIQLLLEEYHALREEADACVTRLRHGLQLGLATLGITIGLGVRLEQHPRSSAMVLAAGVPAIAVASLLLWLAEIEHRARLGSQQIQTEQALNELAGNEVLRWQRRRASSALGQSARTSRSVVAASMFAACALFGAVSGLHAVRHRPSLVILLATFEATLALATAWLVMNAKARFQATLASIEEMLREPAPDDTAC